MIENRTSQQDDQVRQALDWLRDIVGPEEVQRHVSTYVTGVGKVHPNFETITFDPPVDKLGWYLYTAETWLREPKEAEIHAAARVLPTLIAIGSRIEHLDAAAGARARVVDAATGRQEPESILFELLVGGAYAAKGWRVEYLDRESKPTPDMLARKNGLELYIECKRKSRNSGYSGRERKIWKRLFSSVSDYLRATKMPAVLDIVFHKELHTFDVDFLEKLVVPKLSLAVPGQMVENDDVTIALTEPRIEEVRRELAGSMIKLGSTRWNTLLFGEFDKGRSIESLVIVRRDKTYPGYATDLKTTAGAIWSCDAVAAVDAKARDILPNLARADEQLPSGRVGAVHCAVEMRDGEAVEIERYRRMMNSLGSFKTSLRSLWVYCHLLGFDVPPDKSWEMEETVHYWGLGQRDVRKDCRLDPLTVIAVPEVGAVQ